jgi:mannose-6-phosphate isomerase
MNFNLTAQTPRDEAIRQLRDHVEYNGFTIVDPNEDKPWGGYYRIDDKQINKFIDLYFSSAKWDVPQHVTLSPKLLIIAPQSRLSWQYHTRRAEIWRIIFGTGYVEQNSTDIEPEPGIYSVGEIITLPFGTRHRMIAKDNWVVWAELWQHADTNNPSNESDIIRVADDYNRNTK